MQFSYVKLVRHDESKDDKKKRMKKEKKQISNNYNKRVSPLDIKPPFRVVFGLGFRVPSVDDKFKVLGFKR